MYARLLPLPETSFFLFGPRGTGKSTWLRSRLPAARYYDLLDTGESLRLSREPGLLYMETQALPASSWVIIDEVQRAPGLLDEVHRLMEDRKLRFALSGSSARKLRRGGGNLLAGRARVKSLFPLVSAELKSDFNLEAGLSHGTLPLAVGSPDPIGYLTAYAQTYLQEEIRAEALTRNIGAFSRFLEIAARQNGQLTNSASISREASVARQTVQSYFDVLVDTLVGHWIHPWKQKSATRQVLHPKFYFFDTGVVRALSGRLPYPPSDEETGPLLETLLLHELRAFLDYSNRCFPIRFWRNYEGLEVDFILETERAFLAVECKSSKRWERRDSRGLLRFKEQSVGKPVIAIGVYRGPQTMQLNDVEILPVAEFLKRLWAGNLVG